jgi:uncharacterized protein YndB with AHSA1/START domain
MQQNWTYQKEMELNAPVEKVWRALTESEFTKQYMYGCEVVTDWKPGSAIEWIGEHEGKSVVFVKGIIKEIIPQQKLSFTMIDPNMGLEDIPENYVSLTYTLRQKGDRTILGLSQGDYSKVANREQRMIDTEKGWDYALPLLKKVVEQ